VLIHLVLGDTLRESLSVSPMDMDVGADLILGWDWISSHDLRHLYVDGRLSPRSGHALLQLDLLPTSARPATRTLSVIGHGEFRRFLRQIERGIPAVADTPPPPIPPPATLRPSTGWSRPLHADHAELAAVEATAARMTGTATYRSPSLPSTARLPRSGAT
jgi:hypothetical protein